MESRQLVGHDLFQILRSEQVRAISEAAEEVSMKAGETVFCCGPDPMMHAVARLCEARDLKCYLSLENYMACGYGVCNGCTVEVKGPRFEGWPYSKTCQQGPVFEASELVITDSGS